MFHKLNDLNLQLISITEEIQLTTDTSLKWILIGKQYVVFDVLLIRSSKIQRESLYNYHDLSL